MGARDVLVGLDIGGTKCAVRIESTDRELLVDTTIPSGDWDAEPLDAGIAWIRAALHRAVPTAFRTVAVGIGGQGLDNAALMDDFSARLTAALGIPVRAVNDAALLAPAAGEHDALGLIAGTGAIGVGWRADGGFVAAGGWGHVLGDDAGAAGIVREAVKRALYRHDDGLADDGLLAALLAAYGVAVAERLARVVNDEPSVENWAPHAKAVFDAAAAGSGDAALVIDGAAAHLARLVEQLIARGAGGRTVIAAGTVVTAQPLLFGRLAELLAVSRPEYVLRLLDRAPVEGAVQLAADLLVESDGDPDVRVDGAAHPA